MLMEFVRHTIEKSFTEILRIFLEDIDSVSAKKLRRDEVIRHEVIHAFFAESGLSKYGDDEVLVDWIAKQMPKINEAVNKILKSEED